MVLLLQVLFFNMVGSLVGLLWPKTRHHYDMYCSRKHSHWYPAAVVFL